MPVTPEDVIAAARERWPDSHVVRLQCYSSPERPVEWYFTGYSQATTPTQLTRHTFQFSAPDLPSLLAAIEKGK